MKRDIARHLAPAPAAVRSSMLAADLLDAGAAAVVGRFFGILKRRGEPLDAPSRATFDLAATSESTLGTLLRALERHAPQVCLAGGREARKAWYALRPEKGTPRRRGRAPAAAAGAGLLAGRMGAALSGPAAGPDQGEQPAASCRFGEPARGDPSRRRRTGLVPLHRLRASAGPGRRRRQRPDGEDLSRRADRPRPSWRRRRLETRGSARDALRREQPGHADRQGEGRADRRSRGAGRVRRDRGSHREPALRGRRSACLVGFVRASAAGGGGARRRDQRVRADRRRRLLADRPRADPRALGDVEPVLDA